MNTFRKSAIVLLLLAFSLSFTGESFAYPEPHGQGGDVGEEIEVINTKISEKKEGISLLSSKINEYKAKIDEKQKQGATLAVELDLLDNRMAKTKLQVEETKEEISLINLEIVSLNKQLETLEERLEREKKMITGVLQEIQVQDNDLALQLFFGSNSFSDLFDQLQYLENINSDLKKAADQVKASRQVVIQKKENQREKREHLEELEEKLEARKFTLASERNAQDVLLSRTQESEAQVRVLLNDVKQEQAFINSQIAQLQADIEGKLSQSDETGGDGSALSWPVDRYGVVMTTYYHDPTYPFRHLWEHSGLDLAAPTGTPILSAAPGYVAWTRKGKLYGNYVMIIHSNGIATLYAHMSRIDVEPDQFVKRGQQIGAMGSTGFSTGPHLHFETRLNGIPVNPMNYLISN